MTLAVAPDQLSFPCAHHWLLGPVARIVLGRCLFCGVEREFIGSWDEDEQQGKRYGRNYQTLRGAAKASAKRRLNRDPS